MLEDVRRLAARHTILGEAKFLRAMADAADRTEFVGSENLRLVAQRLEKAVGLTDLPEKTDAGTEHHGRWVAYVETFEHRRFNPFVVSGNSFEAISEAMMRAEVSPELLSVKALTRLPYVRLKVISEKNNG